MQPLTLRRQGRNFSAEIYSQLSNMGILASFSRSSKTNQPSIIWRDDTSGSGLKKPSTENVAKGYLRVVF